MYQDIYKKAIELRHELHMHPELSYEEVWTKAHLIEFLKENTDLEIVDKGKWFYAAYRGGSDDAGIGFRADFDALPMDDDIDKPWKSTIPGKGHKCGHDGHSATLCAFAMLLDRIRPAKNVFLVFQHAEENAMGACECGDFVPETGISEIYAFHIAPGMEYGTVKTHPEGNSCASMGWTVEMIGSPTHASAPELGNNPVLPLCKVAEQIEIVADQSRFEKLVLATIVEFSAGEHAFGIAASKGRIGVTLRAESDKDMYQIRDELESFAKEIAEKANLQVNFTYEDVFPDTTNTPQLAQKVIDAAKSLGLPTILSTKINRGSEDFGWFLKQIPGAQFEVSNGIDTPAIHTTAFDFDDSLIELVCKLYLKIIEV